MQLIYLSNACMKTGREEKSMAEMYDRNNTQEDIDSAEYAQKCALKCHLDSQHTLDEIQNFELITEI